MKNYIVIFLVLVSFISCTDKEDCDYISDSLISRSIDPWGVVTMQDIYDDEYSTLTAYQRKELIKAGNELLLYCACLQPMLKDAYKRERKIKFVIDPHMNAKAYFHTSTMTIAFRDMSCLTNRYVILEELLHFFQYTRNGSSYMRARKNVEFEVKVIQDVIWKVNGITTQFGVSGKEASEYAGAYWGWIWGMVHYKKIPGVAYFNGWVRDWKGEPDTLYDDLFKPLLLYEVLSEIYATKQY